MSKGITLTIAMISAAYSNFAPNEYTPKIFEQILGDLPDDLLEAAVMKCLGEPRAFAPAPGEIRETAIKLQAQAGGVPSAAEAYEEVANMPASMKRIAGYEWDEAAGKNWINEVNLTFSHPFVETIARRIGWPKSFPTDNPSADRAQFLRVYDSELTSSLRTEMQLPTVAQYIERNHAAALISGIAKQLEAK